MRTTYPLDGTDTAAATSMTSDCILIDDEVETFYLLK